jgi:hypothetical protein
VVDKLSFWLQSGSQILFSSLISTPVRLLGVPSAESHCVRAELCSHAEAEGHCRAKIIAVGNFPVLHNDISGAGSVYIYPSVFGFESPRTEREF